jgi:hypothetical protein
MDTMKKQYCFVQNGQVVNEIPYLPDHLRHKKSEELRALGYYPLVREDEVYKAGFMLEDGTFTTEFNPNFEIANPKQYLVLDKYVVTIFTKRNKTEEELNEQIYVLKYKLKQDIEKKREYVLAQGFIFEGSKGKRIVDTSTPMHIRAIHTKLVASSALQNKGLNKQPQKISGKNDVTYNTDADEAVQIGLAFAEHEQFVYEYYQQHKENIEQLQTVDECLDYDINDNWGDEELFDNPEVFQ